MEETIDKDFVKNQSKDKSNLTQNIELRAVIYFLVMLIGGVIYLLIFSKPSPSIFASLLHTFFTIVVSLFVALAIVLVRIFIRQRKNKKKGLLIEYDPFWFEIIENGFSLWILVMLLNFLVYIFGG